MPPITAPKRIHEQCYLPYKICQQHTLELDRRHHFDEHNRLQDHGTCLVVRLTEGAKSRNAERQFRGVDGMISTILEYKSAARDRMTRQRPLLNGVVEALNTGINEKISTNSTVTVPSQQQEYNLLECFLR